VILGLTAAVARNSGAQVVNVSATVDVDHLTAEQIKAFEDAAETARSNDILIVVASGNRPDYANANPVTYPGQLAVRFPNVVAVSGVNDKALWIRPRSPARSRPLRRPPPRCSARWRSNGQSPAAPEEPALRQRSSPAPQP